MKSQIFRNCTMGLHKPLPLTQGEPRGDHPFLETGRSEGWAYLSTVKVRRPCLAVSTPASAPHPETGESEAQRLICQKLQEGSQSLGCGLPRLAALGRDRQSGCSQLCIRAEPASCVESRPCAAGSRRTPGGPASTRNACFHNSDGPSPRWSQGLVRGTAGDEAGRRTVASLFSACGQAPAAG